MKSLTLLVALLTAGAWGQQPLQAGAQAALQMLSRGSIIAICGAKTNGRVANCSLRSGYTLDDVMNAVADMQSKPSVDVIGFAPQPEPMDVPAINILNEQSLQCQTSMCNEILNKQTRDKCLATLKPRCADKRRVLLTGEDGVRHCILFPKEQP